MTYLTRRATPAQTAQPWQRETVQSFFAEFPWLGGQLFVKTDPTASVDTESLLNATVGHFFESFLWEGKPTIGMPISPTATQQSVETTTSDLTLDDISSLFG
jgi:hypothetical protein